MCGIGGIVTRQAQAFPHAALAEMGRMLQHRGPDDYGVLLWGGEGTPRRGRDLDLAGPTRIGLVHRRLSIIDLTAGGWQPMSSQRWALGHHLQRRDLQLHGAAQGA